MNQMKKMVKILFCVQGRIDDLSTVKYIFVMLPLPLRLKVSQDSQSDPGKTVTKTWPTTKSSIGKVNTRITVIEQTV